MLKKKNKTIRCDYCGDEVPYIRKTKKFCCPKCRVYFWRAKQYEMRASEWTKPLTSKRNEVSKDE